MSVLPPHKAVTLGGDPDGAVRFLHQCTGADRTRSTAERSELPALVLAPDVKSAIGSHEQPPVAGPVNRPHGFIRERLRFGNRNDDVVGYLQQSAPGNTNQYLTVCV